MLNISIPGASEEEPGIEWWFAEHPAGDTRF
jgi:hypothetical protein